MFLVFVFCAYVVIVVLSMIIFHVLFIMCPCLFVSSLLTLSNYSIYMFSFLYILCSLLVALFIWFAGFCLGLDSVCV